MARYRPETWTASEYGSSRPVVYYGRVHNPVRVHKPLPPEETGLVRLLRLEGRHDHADEYQRRWDAHQSYDYEPGDNALISP